MIHPYDALREELAHLIWSCIKRRRVTGCYARAGRADGRGGRCRSQACRLVRVDAGGGSQGDVNWLLARGYRVLAKEYSTERATRLAGSVRTWVADLRHAEWEVGWVTDVPTEYMAPVRRLAVRCKKGNGQWGYGVLITNLSLVAGAALSTVPLPTAPELRYVYLYDGRGGAAETTFKEDRQGLGPRYKKRWAAAQVATYLRTLAHNVLLWAREWLAPVAPWVAHYGVKRSVRDVWAVPGRVEWRPGGAVQRIILNQAHCLTQHLLAALQALVAPMHVVITSGET